VDDPSSFAGKARREFPDVPAHELEELGIGVPAEERLARAFRRSLLGRVAVVVGVVAFALLFLAQHRGVSDDARAESEILACGKVGCARRHYGGELEWIGLGCTDNEGLTVTDHTYEHEVRESGSAASFRYATITCPRKHFLFGAHECRRVHPDLAHPPPVGPRIMNPWKR
jgi:hypothetical protein